MKEELSALLARRGPISRIGVIGMGYVGIPSAAVFANCPEFDFVWGFQRDSPTSGYKIEMLNAGRNPLVGKEPELEALVGKAVEAGKFACTADFSTIAEVDAVTIAVQTPFRNSKDLLPDFGSLEAALKNVGANLREGMLVVLESTVTPGTTEGLARDILERASGLKAGEDFALAHAPERVMVGRLVRNLREHDRVVGGIDEASTKRAVSLYAPILTSGRVIPMSATAAEVTKTAENTFRDLQIAAINQLALYCESMGINVYDVRTGIDSLKGEGVSRGLLFPGAGVGGHCLPKDTYHLERGVKVLGGMIDYPDSSASLFVLARQINDFMPRHMHYLTFEGLKRAGKVQKGAKIALLGWAFLKNTDDARNTPSEVYYSLCVDEGAEVVVHDPYVKRYGSIRPVTDLQDVIRNADAIAIFTDHDEYRTLDPALIREWSDAAHPVIIDGRNILDPGPFIEHGFIFKGIGRGDMNHHAIRHTHE
jgi:UDP-N-acetyl-D-mannosaminuronic acid dehydrogenase